jgi:hypothetical protein
MATFILGGIWHGAGWTFVFWGFLHGLALVIHRFWKTLGFTMPKILAWFITFNFINIAWVFFRAKEWEDAVRVLKGMININSLSFHPLEHITFLKMINIQDSISTSSMAYLFMGILFLVTLFGKNSIQLSHIFMKYKTISTIVCALIFVIAIYNLNNGSEFLYFNF